MPRRTSFELEVERLASAMAGTLGREVRATRRRRRLTLQALGGRVGLSHTRVAFDRPLGIELSRDRSEPRDAGHLAVQELVLRLARTHGRHRGFELPTRPSDPARSVDVGLRDDVYRVLILIECLNRVLDLGDVARQASRKEAEAEILAMSYGGDGPYRVASCWVLRDSAANRDLVRRYPEVLRTRFPGSSAAWVRCLAEGAEPPRQPGLVWADPGSGRLSAVRLG